MTKMMFAAAAVAALLGGQAFAADASTSVAVNTQGVNYNDRAAVQQLYTRINVAAVKACETPSQNRYIRQADQSCVDKAVADAVRKTDRPLLTAAYQGAVSSNAMATNEQ
jgi:UrcA family protein